MKVLLGWELGSGQGHIQRLVALAQQLESYGCQPVFALKNYNPKGLDFKWHHVLAPRLPFFGRESSYTFTDILANFGFAHGDLLNAHLHSWQTILKTLKPDLVITDHAPGLVLATCGIVPTVVIGSHFAVPPPVEAFPILRFPAPAESEEHQRNVSETVRQITGLDSPLGKLLNGDRSFIFSIPELDCYRGWRINPEYVGIHTTPLHLNQDCSHRTNWAYLDNAYPLKDLVLETLNPDSEFKPLNEAFSGTSLAIHHAGLTTAIACLLAGIPQLLLPRHLEQQLNARYLTQLGVACAIANPTWETLHMTQAETYALTEKARSVAATLAHWNQNFIERIVHTCFQLL